MSHASSITLLSDTRFLVTYDFSDESQLLDFTTTAGTIMSLLSPGVVQVAGYAGDITGLIWRQRGSVRNIQFSHNRLFTRHSNVYTNLSDLWVGASWKPNPGLGSIWANNGSYWVVDGSSQNYASTHVDNTWYDFEFGVSTSQLSSISSANGVEYLRNGTFTLNIDGITAIGSYCGANLIGPLTIEVEIRRPYTTGDETIAFNTFGATFEADITVDDGAVVNKCISVIVNVW